MNYLQKIEYIEQSIIDALDEFCESMTFGFATELSYKADL